VPTMPNLINFLAVGYFANHTRSFLIGPKIIFLLGKYIDIRYKYRFSPL
jgi:hypothetical protein